MTEQTFGGNDGGNGGNDDLSSQEGLPGEIGTPEGEAGPSETDPDTAADYGDGGGPTT